MTEIAKAYVQIVPTTKDMSKNLAGELDGPLAEHGKKAGKDWSSAFSTAAKAGLAAVAAAGAAVISVSKSAVESFAEYEQLSEGSKLMFGDAYDYIAQKAETAFKDVQMSQNDYLQQVNGFATGLKTALGGNEQAAAELADKIIKAEADVVAATGNSQEAVQNAFNGIMKSNYTMLDNLQLGIKPTKEGMQEVIDKVNEWNAANGNATSYVIDNLADCQSALVDYIAMQGMAGYAAEEGATTLQGSTATMKASWQNLLTGLAGDTQNLEPLINNFVESATNTVQLIIPRIQQALSGIGQLVTQLVPIIAAELPGLANTLLPDLLSAAQGIILGLMQGLASNAETIATTAQTVILQFVQFVTSNAGQMADLAITIILALANGLIAALPDLMAAAPTIIGELINSLVQHLPEIIDTAARFVLAFVEGLIGKLNSIVEACSKIVDSIKETIGKVVENAKTWGHDMVTNFSNGITARMNGLLENVRNLASKIKSYLGFSEPEEGPLSNFHTYAPDMMELFASGIRENSGLVEDAVSGIADMASADIRLASPSAAFSTVGTAEASYSPAPAANDNGDASMTLISLLTRQNELLRELIAKSGTYIDGKLINDSLNRYRRAAGV